MKERLKSMGFIFPEKIKDYIKTGVIIVYISITIMFLIGLMNQDPVANKDGMGGPIGAWFIITLPVLFLIVGVPKEDGEK
ncbi:hypothetical protein [Klebsiella pneumoniae]|uniref:hypothetical protein n=1 Tax=Klebsiella pneumoniae TaxID=573 RepID=UPI002271561C|nr:hypothetical protein [Klebsiella pneumoniae]MDK9312721.1 hypothetical protein [Klebsiella pneumoniae]MDK9318027.1 hypothetical protein [Klebsiella pneumoniae]MDK9318226.1 hypothetical protein [Klebsiella pneumoniae]MDK9371531.1 hypothetical protein [Klebsiella pneumoniae]MDK9381518.1 hypothetical protein [Klebsiella pneumoniae]